MNRDLINELNEYPIIPNLLSANATNLPEINIEKMKYDTEHPLQEEDLNQLKLWKKILLEKGKIHIRELLKSPEFVDLKVLSDITIKIDAGSRHYERVWFKCNLNEHNPHDINGIVYITKFKFKSYQIESLIRHIINDVQRRLEDYYDELINKYILRDRLSVLFQNVSDISRNTDVK